MTTSRGLMTLSRRVVPLAIGLLIITAPGAAMAHHHHHDNGGDDSSGSGSPPSVPQHGSPALTGVDYVYRGKDGKLHHSSDGSIVTTTTVRDHRNSEPGPGGDLPAGTVVHDHRNGKDCSYTVGDQDSRRAYQSCEQGGY